MASRDRPQDPRPPYPYHAEEVTVLRAQVELKGTLTIPPGSGPFPAALLITGSGPQDRDSTLFGHRPFLVLADYLTRAGVAVLRVDDRGVAESGGSRVGLTTQDYAEDALSELAFLADHPSVDPECVGLIGHSEGGVIAPLVAIRSKKAAFLVLMATTGIPGDEVVVSQIRAASQATGVDPAQLRQQTDAHKEVLRLVASSAPRAELRAAVEQLVRAQGVPAEEEEASVEGSLEVLSTEWLRSFISYDPREALRQITIPVLVLNGERDLQVLPDQNLPQIERALQEAGNDDVTVHRFPGLNHLFQTSTTGHPDEYESIDETMAPLVLETIRDWVRARSE